MKINRQLFSGEKTCSANCMYCFAKWPGFMKQPVISTQRISDQSVIVYPCCDSDISENEGYLEHLWAIAEREGKTYVSISTKKQIPDELITQYQELDCYLRKYKKGFIKISVSVTAKYQINQIEPGTDSYYKRKEFFIQLQENGFTPSLIFKPVLPFISDVEYQEIVADFSSCDYFLLGDLYVHADTEFYKKYILDQYPERSRKISWLNSTPCWQYVEQDDKIQKLAQFITEQNKEVFYSDVDLIYRMAEHEKVQG